MSYTW